mgnify:CR=1 FL=1
MLNNAAWLPVWTWAMLWSQVPFVQPDGGNAPSKPSLTRAPVGGVGVGSPGVGVPVGVRVGEVLGDVPTWVDHDRLPGLLVGDQVRGLGEAVEVVLGEEHGVSSIGRHGNTIPRGV